MKTLLVLLFTFFSISNLNAQTIESPDFKSADDLTTKILRIERNSKFTVVTFEHTNDEGAWITLNSGIYIQDADGQAMFKFIKAENIPLMPEKYHFKKHETKTFKVYFEKIPAQIKSVNIIERAVPRNEPVSYLNFFGVKLDKSGTGKTYKEMVFEKAAFVY